MKSVGAPGVQFLSLVICGGRCTWSQFAETELSCMTRSHPPPLACSLPEFLQLCLPHPVTTRTRSQIALQSRRLPRPVCEPQHTQVQLPCLLRTFRREYAHASILRHWPDRTVELDGDSALDLDLVGHVLDH